MQPLKLLSSRPGIGVKHGVLVLLLNPGQEPPTRSTISDMIGGRTAFVEAGMELADDVSLAVFHRPDESLSLP